MGLKVSVISAFFCLRTKKQNTEADEWREWYPYAFGYHFRFRTWDRCCWLCV